MGASSFAADQPAIRQVSSEGIRHSILICGRLTQLINEKSEVVWQVNEHSRDGSVLPNGNILFSANNVAKEMTRDMKVVWRYALAKPNKELGTASRLANGNTLVVERGPKPRLLEITKDGNVAVEVPLKPETDNGHMQTRMARKLPNGNYIVPHLLAFKVKEYKPDGTVVNEIKTDLTELGGRAAENWPFTAIRLANGNTVVNLTHGNKTVEFDAQGTGRLARGQLARCWALRRPVRRPAAAQRQHCHQQLRPAKPRQGAGVRGEPRKGSCLGVVPPGQQRPRHPRHFNQR